MNKITRRLWDRGINLKKWSDINGFKYRYVILVVHNHRGGWDVGVAKKIKDALIAQCFATDADFNREAAQ